ncbi:MAG: TIGR01777 family protein [Elusimicrobia bacterium]|nr:TIGR01777 family protein [Elusimicrobiota bacterium]
MKIVIAGGTGFIGRALASASAAAGDEVVVLSRRPSLGAPKTVVWDGASTGSWQQALEGADAVVNLSGESVAEARWNEPRKKLLISSRLNATRALVAALSAAKQRPKVFLSSSAVGYYGDRGDELLDESSKPGSDFLSKLCQDWEKEARVAEPLGVRTVVLRTGIVLAQGGGALSKMLPIFKTGFGGPLGNGGQWMSWIALEDLVGLIRHAVVREVSGPLNGTAPNPAVNKDFSRALGRALGRPALLPAPAFALRLALGEMAGMLLGGQRALPKRLLETGYSFKRPDLESALRSIIG